eukprot:28657-Pelagococcus_subviridis.AAC.2
MINKSNRSHRVARRRVTLDNDYLSGGPLASKYSAWCSTTNSPSANSHFMIGSRCNAQILLCASGANPGNSTST